MIELLLFVLIMGSFIPPASAASGTLVVARTFPGTIQAKTIFRAGELRGGLGDRFWGYSLWSLSCGLEYYWLISVCI